MGECYTAACDEDGDPDAEECWLDGDINFREFDFDRNLPFLAANEVREFYFPNEGFGFGNNFYRPELTPQKRPWWTMSPDAPVVLSLADPDNTFCPVDSLSGLPRLVENMRDRTLIIVLFKCSRPDREWKVEPEFFSSGATMEDVSFELETDPIRLGAPDQESRYKREILRQLAQEKGAPLAPKANVEDPLPHRRAPGQREQPDRRQGRVQRPAAPQGSGASAGPRLRLSGLCLPQPEAKPAGKRPGAGGSAGDPAAAHPCGGQHDPSEAPQSPGAALLPHSLHLRFPGRPGDREDLLGPGAGQGDGDPGDNRMLRFLQSNPGINSRVSFKIWFQDFQVRDLTEVFRSMLEWERYVLPPKTVAEENFFRCRLKSPAFGNCREARNLADRVKLCLSARLAERADCPREELSGILPQDVEGAAAEILEEYRALERDGGRAIGFSGGRTGERWIC